jgi:hypothetical protein
MLGGLFVSVPTPFYLKLNYESGSRLAGESYTRALIIYAVRPEGHIKAQVGISQAQDDLSVFCVF